MMKIITSKEEHAIMNAANRFEFENAEYVIEEYQTNITWLFNDNSKDYSQELMECGFEYVKRIEAMDLTTEQLYEVMGVNILILIVCIIVMIKYLRSAEDK